MIIQKNISEPNLGQLYQDLSSQIFDFEEIQSYNPSSEEIRLKFDSSYVETPLLDQILSSHEPNEEPVQDGSESIDQYPEIDLSGMLENKSLLKWISGKLQNHIPYYNNVKAAITRPGQTTVGLVNANTSYETFLEMQITPRETDNYRFSGFFHFSLDSAMTDFIDRITVFTESGEGTLYQEEGMLEMKDSAGTAPEDLDRIQSGVINGSRNPGTNQKAKQSFEFDLQLTKNITYTYRLEWRSQQNNVEATIYDGQLSCEQKTLTA